MYNKDKMISLKLENQIIKFYQNGLTGDEIKVKLNIGRQLVYYYLKKNNVKRRSVGHRKGKPTWNKGIKLSNKQKAKLNLKGLKIGHGFFKGKTGIYSKETLIKMIKAHIGKFAEKSSNWKGGISRVYKTGYNSFQYKEWRKKVFERDDYTCQKCGIRCGNGRVNYLTAHHKKSFSKYPKLRFELNNGITLCEPCHCKIDKYRARFIRLEA